MASESAGPRWLVVAGPTAAGKTEIALELAETFGGEIVNADSRQVFRGMDVGTAKPTAAERARVPHHLFDVVAPDEPFDVARYRALAREKVLDIAASGHLPIVVGGTGLYLKTLARGLFAGPAADPSLRAALEGVERRAPGALARWCRRLDPETAGRLHPNDRVRLVRAIEVALATGEPLSAFHARHGFAEPLGELLYLVMAPPREALTRRIIERSRRLFSSGLLDEVRRLSLEGYGPELRVMQSIGYREAWTVLRGERTIEEATDDLVRSTRRFAKRQLTWFRAERTAVWLDPETERRAIVDLVRAFAASPGN